MTTDTRVSSSSIGSTGSTGSILSIGSTGSILSIGSAGSILSIGSAGSILAIGSAGSVGGILSFVSFFAVLSGASAFSVLSWRKRRAVGDVFRYSRCNTRCPTTISGSSNNVSGPLKSPQKLTPSPSDTGRHVESEDAPT